MEERFEEYEDQLENEDDIDTSWDEQISESVTSSSDWTTETILSQINKGNIILDPEFQRRTAWTNQRKSRFIESLILGLPVPQIVLAQSKENRGKYIVLDGKQRLLSIKSFAVEDESGEFKKLKLRGLEIKESLNGKSLIDIQNDPDFDNELSSFENQTIRTVIIKNWPDENYLYHVFLRLNTGSVQLSPQELRQALHPGGFVKFIAIESETCKPLRYIFNKTEPDFRMRDAELLVRYYAFRNFILSYNGNLKEFLDTTCKVMNSAWTDKKDEIKMDLNEFVEGHNTLLEIFGTDIYRKYNGSVFENRFNRAVFDVQIYYFSQKEIRDNIDKTEVKNVFENLCKDNAEFLKSVETTTKSISATQARLKIFGEKINDLMLRGTVRIPKIG